MPRTGILDSLDTDQRDQLISWMETLPIKTVLERLAAPPPEGFNIRSHTTSLRRFYQREKIRGNQDNIGLARNAVLTEDEAKIMRSAAVSAFTSKVFEIATAAGSNPADLANAARWLTSVQQHELRLEQLRLRRAEFDLQLQKLRFAASVQETKAHTPDDAQTIREAAKRFES